MSRAEGSRVCTAVRWTRIVWEISVLLRIDNTTAVCYINMMSGTHLARCNEIARGIWSYAVDHKMHLSVAHIAGADNVHADHASRNFVNPDIELDNGQ